MGHRAATLAIAISDSAMKEPWEMENVRALLFIGTVEKIVLFQP